MLPIVPGLGCPSATAPAVTRSPSTVTRYWPLIWPNMSASRRHAGDNDSPLPLVPIESNE